MLSGSRLGIATALALALVAALALPVPSVKAQSDEDLEALNQQVVELYRAGKYGEATPLAERYVALTKSRHGEEHAQHATALNNLAVLYRAQGRYAEAEPLYNRALAIYEKAHGREHPLVGTTLNNLAGLYQDQGRYAEAEPLYKRALAIDEKALGPEHPSVGTALNNLAELYRAQGRYAEAEPLFKRALAITEKALGPDHPHVGRALNNLATLSENQGKVEDAEPLYRRALAIGEKALPPGHPLLALMRGNLGGLYKSQGRRTEAEPLLKSALEINEKVFGPTHPKVAYDLTQLGDLYRLQGKCDQAEPLFLRARAIGAAAIEEVPVLFGTDRKRDLSEPSVTFGGERAQGLSFGLVIVTVPKDETSAPKVAQAAAAKGAAAAETTEARRLAMHCIEAVNDKQIVEAAVRRLGVSKTYPNQAFVFVHGYNVSFENALRRAAQIAYDIKFDGGTFLFSWPSRERLWGYLSDSDTVQLAADHLKEFLEKIVAETKVTKIHFVAHSMGNMVLLRALERIAGDGSKLRRVIGEIVHAAPDVDPDLFVRMVKTIKAKGGNFTLYASRGDWALRISSWLRGLPRAGFISDRPLIVAGVETIDITDAGINLFALNHDVYASNPTIVADMRRIIAKSERPPDKRTKEFEAVASKDGTYWRLRVPQAVAQQ
jgi:esterase/lipase superfamily enzyme/Tfp pilus assembly protein PilF